MTITDPNELNESDRTIFDAGVAWAIADRRERDRLETEQIFRQCTRDPLEHYQNLEAESAAIAKDRERRASA